MFRVRSSLRFLACAYYPTLLACGGTGFGLAALRDGRLVGYLVGALDDAVFHRVLVRRHPLACTLALVRRLLAGGAPDPRRLGGGEPRFHYLAVAPGERGAGLGRRLVLDGLALVRAAGGRSCASRIYLDNEAWLSLHLALGAELVREGEDALGRFAVCRFELA